MAAGNWHKMVLELNISPPKQIAKDYDVMECISIEEIEKWTVYLFFFRIM